MVNLKTFRLVAFGVTLFASVVVLGLAAHVTNTFLSLASVSFDFSGLAIATAVLSLATIPVMLFLDANRTGAFTSWVAVEISWLFVLWVMWLAAAAKTADFYTVTRLGEACKEIDSSISSSVTAACGEIPAIMGLGFLTWLILMAYSITLLVYAIIGANRGHKVWTSSVKQGEWLGPAPPPAQPGQPGGPTLAQPQPQMYQPYPSGTPPAQPYPGTPYSGQPGQPGYPPQPGSPVYPPQGYPPAQGYPPQQYPGSPPPQQYPGSPPQQTGSPYPQV